MKEKFMELLKEKARKGKTLSEIDKKAKLSILDAINQMMDDEDSEQLGKLKKVTVMSPTKEGMEAGLEKAKEVIDKQDQAESAKSEMEDEEGYEQELSEDDEKARKIAELKAQLAELEA